MMMMPTMMVMAGSDADCHASSVAFSKFNQNNFLLHLMMLVVVH